MNGELLKQVLPALGQFFKYHTTRVFHRHHGQATPEKIVSTVAPERPATVQRLALSNSPANNERSPPVALYIELLKKCLTDSIYGGDLDMARGKFVSDPSTGKVHATGGDSPDPEMIRLGFIWPNRAHTMIGMPRLENIQLCVEAVLKAGTPGDFIETGVWRGGASIFMRGLLKAYGVIDRKVWVADSFEGLPPADVVRYPKDRLSETETGWHEYADLAVSLDQVRQNFDRYGLLDEQVRFLPGWFRDTLPTAPIERLAIMRLDGDMYESTMDGLTHLYPKLQPGGFVIIDDYNKIFGCHEATLDFRRQHNITTEIVAIEGFGAFWRKDAQ